MVMIQQQRSFARSQSRRRGRRAGSAMVASAASVVAVALLVSPAMADSLTVSGNASDNATVQPGGPRSGSNGKQFFNVEGGGLNSSADFGVIDFSAPSFDIGNNVVNSVNSMTLTLYNAPTSFTTAGPTSIDFYLSQDTSTSIQSSTTNPPIKYLTGVTPAGVGNTQLAPLTFLGSGTYTNPSATLDANGHQYYSYTLSVPSGIQSYLTNQLNNNSNLRFVATMTDASTANKDAATYAGATSSTPESLSLGLTTTPNPTPNTAVSYVSTAGTKSISVGINPSNGNRFVGSGLIPVKIGNDTAGNTNTSPLVYSTSITAGSAGAVSVAGATNPLAAGGTTTIQAGITQPNDNAVHYGTDLVGEVIVHNNNNPSDGDITIDVTGHDVSARFVDSAQGSSATDLGKILVGATKTATGISITTTNGGTSGTDYNHMVTTTLKANATATFTSSTNSVINYKLTGTAPGFDQVFDNAQTGTINASVTVGVSGDHHTTAASGGTFVSVPMQGEGDPGEQASNDSSFVYAQWAGYQAASLSASGGANPVLSGGTVTVANAASNDNGTKGLRATAEITGVSFNQGGWSQTGLTPGANGTGTTIAGGASAPQTVNFDPTGKLNGTYTSTESIQAENDHTIYGAAVNDLAPVTASVQGTANTAGGQGAGSYTLDGGGYNSNGTVNLTGSFTQTGGAATFGQITGGGALALNGGSTAISAGTGTSTVNSLSIAGGKLDLANNALDIHYGAAESPAAAIRSYLVSGYNGGAWNGTTGIVSPTNAGATTGLTLGYADGADGVVSGLSAGDVLVKYVRVGDANLDGVVDFTDFQILGQHFGTASNKWTSGDFNYDGTTDFTDFQLLGQNYGLSGSSPAQLASIEAFGRQFGYLLTPNADGVGFTFTPVPEPASLGVLGVVSLAAVGRRRRAGSHC